ncbi:zinc-dependent metalloprotease, partial [Raoultella terrigena]|uniref:zinc-dependent metalloprotease n=1 Tax=Raoultella terrigena TaxID=577 RepID=UPI0015F2D883
GKWLRLALISQITDFARGIRIDTTRLEELAENFDPANPEELREAMTSGALIPPKTEEQLAAHARLETMLALIEGWVDVVTAAATTRLPKAGSVAETVRRRRASGGPAESAFATLVGLELRPRRLREAAA